MTFSPRGPALAVLILTLAAWSGAPSGFAVSPMFRNYDVLDNITATASLDGSSIIVDLANAAGSPPSQLFIQTEYRALLIVPSDAKINPDVLELEGLHYTRNNPADGQTFTLNADSPSTAPVELTQFLRYNYVGRMRQFHIGVITFDYSTRTREGDKLFHMRRARVRLGFDRLPPHRPELGEELTPLDRQLLEAITINASDWRALQAPRRPLTDVQPNLDWIERVNASPQPALKMRVYEEGFYFLSGEQIRAAGVDPALFAADRVNIFRQGRMIPAMVQSAGKTLQRSSRLIFYCPPLDRLSEPWAEFWLIEDAASTVTKRLAPLSSILVNQPRAEDRATSPSEALPADSIPIQRDIFDHGDYFPSMSSDAPNGMWYTIMLHHLKPRELTFTIDKPSKEGMAAFTFHARLLQPRDATSLEFYLNGERIATHEAQGLSIIKAQVEVPASRLRDGENALGLLMPEGDNSNQAPQCMFIGFTVKYPRTLEMAESSFVKTDLPSDHAPIIIPSVRTNLMAWDVSDPFEARVAVGIKLTANGNDVIISPGQGNRRLAMALETAIKPVTMVRRVERFGLADESRQGDFVIVAHPSQLGSLPAFVEWKREQGFRPLVVNVYDVFDQFGFGEKSDTALHRYFRHALESWHSAPLQWVMLVGEASDYPVAEERASNKDIQIDQVPTFGFGRPFDRVKADSGYALMDPSDLLPDFVICRLPSATAAEAAGSLAKLIDFQRAAKTGPQLYRSMFLSDDEPEFEEILDTLIRNIIPPSVEPLRVYQRHFPYEFYWRVFMRRQSPVATARIIQGINDGLHTILFFGHGGPNIWTGERLIHLKDLALMTNRDKLTFIVAATCNASWLDFPVEPGRHALGERLITMPGGGAYAMFAPTTGTTPSEHEFLMTYLYEAIFKHKMPSTGAAMIYCKAFYAATRKNAFVLDQYIITGDASWGVPPLRPDPLPLNVVPTAVNYYERSAIRAKGEMPNMKWGSAAIMLTWPGGESRVMEQQYQIYNGTLDYTLNLPADAPPGDYILTVQGIDSKSGETAVASQPIALVKPTVEAGITILPQKPVHDANQEIRLRIALENKSDVPLSNITFRVSVDGNVQKEGQINLQAREITHADATIQAQPGAREIRAVAEYKQDGKPEIVAQASQVIVTAFPEGGARIYCQADDIELVPESIQPGRPPRINVRLRNLGRQNIENLLLEVRNRENQIISERVALPLLPERGTKDVIVDFLDPLATGEHSVSVSILRAPTFADSTIDPLVLRTVTKRLRVVTGPDLEVAADSIEFQSHEYLVGQTVEITATVTNKGFSPSANVPVRAYRNKANVMEFQMKPEFSAPDVTIPALQPGQSHTFTLRWDNNILAGRHTVVIVADPNQTGGETYWDNNIASKPIVIKSPANFTLRAGLTTYEPQIITRQTEVAVSTVVENTGPWPSEPATFEVFELGVAGDQRHLMDEQMLPPLQPGETIEKNFKWRVSDRYPALEIVVNRLRDAAESNHADNSYKLAPLYLISDRALPLGQAPENLSVKRVHQLTGTLPWGSFARMASNPANALIFIDKGNAPDKQAVLFAPSQVVNATVLSSEEDAEAASQDNYWRFNGDVIEAAPEEDPAPLQLAVPVPGHQGGNYYDVYLSAQSTPDYLNYPSSYAEVRAEGEKDFRPVDMTSSPTPWGADRKRIGRFAIEDGVFDIEIRKNRTGVWTRLHALEFEPYQALYTSPAYHIRKPWLGTQRGRFLLAGDNLEEGDVGLEVRCGNELEPGRYVWTDWMPMPWEGPGQSAVFPLTGRYLQFQLRLNATPTKEPVIRAIDFALE